MKTFALATLIVSMTLSYAASTQSGTTQTGYFVDENGSVIHLIPGKRNAVILPAYQPEKFHHYLTGIYSDSDEFVINNVRGQNTTADSKISDSKQNTFFSGIYLDKNSAITSPETSLDTENDA